MYEPSSLLISKLSATGNDFLLIGLTETPTVEAWRVIVGDRSMTDVARRLCDRHRGVGADGILLLKKQADYDYAWDFYNQDGSAAEMCGNAARCAGLWAARQEKKWRKFRFLTASGPIEVDREASGLVDVTMPKLSVTNGSLELNLPMEKKSGSFVDSGVPHFVIEEKNLNVSERLTTQARLIRAHPKLGKSGANVTYFQRLKESEIRATTFERGVENFTLACGTGAVAAAFTAYPDATRTKRITVRVPGGDLSVILGESTPRLVGPAHWVADLSLHTHEAGVFTK